MNDKLRKVAEFHKLFEHPINEPGSVEDRKIRSLRIKLLFEELEELARASDMNETFYRLCMLHAREVIRTKEGHSNAELAEGDRWMEQHIASMGLEDGDMVDKVEELDALCDIEYVLMGKVLTSGLHKVFDREFDVVHQNNLDKAHRSEEHAQETARRKGLQNYSITPKDGVFLLLDKDLKLTKPYDHLKVKLNINE